MGRIYLSFINDSLLIEHIAEITFIWFLNELQSVFFSPSHLLYRGNPQVLLHPRHQLEREEAPAAAVENVLSPMAAAADVLRGYVLCSPVGSRVDKRHRNRVSTFLHQTGFGKPSLLAVSPGVFSVSIRLIHIFLVRFPSSFFITLSVE